MTIEVDVAIIGAGVVGLAIAAEVAEQGRSVFVFERNSTFGQETSSRNSEVIHAGIYYPENSMKAKLCVEGNRLLYNICEQYNIPYKRLGKIIVAATEDQIPKLENIYKQASKNGVCDLEFISLAYIKELEPNVTGRAGILSPSTGIIDTHSLMTFFHKKAVENGAEFLFEVEVVGLDKHNDGWKVSIRDWEGISELTSQVLINCAGLGSDKIAFMAGIENDEYRIHYCKGEYFSLNAKHRGSVKRLVYPTPEIASLGVHVVLSLDGMMRLGPNATYVDSIDYKVDKAQREAFFESAKRLLPFIDLNDLQPDFAGIRPKLQAPGEMFRDFIIEHEDKAGLNGLINLVGIESPGLTASPAIAKLVSSLTSDIIN